MLLGALLLVQSATFQNPRVRESSGVAVSRAYPGVFWTHNDSGDGPYLFATDSTGADRGRLLVPGAQAIDWEDMSLGPCPRPLARSAPRPTWCIYIADTGDNLARRSSVTVYAVPEPLPPALPGDTLRTTRAPLVLRLRYPDGAHDVEAIYVAPRDTALFLVSKGAKRGTEIRVYRVDRSSWSRANAPGDIVEATRVQTLDIRPSPESGRVVTGGAVRSDGRLIALRTYSEIFLFYSGVGGRLFPARELPCDIAGIDRGGEAIAFLDMTRFVLTSEAVGGYPGTIHTVNCPLSPEPSTR